MTAEVRTTVVTDDLVHGNDLHAKQPVGVLCRDPLSNDPEIMYLRVVLCPEVPVDRYIAGGGGDVGGDGLHMSDEIVLDARGDC